MAEATTSERAAMSAVVIKIGAWLAAHTDLDVDGMQCAFLGVQTAMMVDCAMTHPEWGQYIARIARAAGDPTGAYEDLLSYLPAKAVS